MWALRQEARGGGKACSLPRRSGHSLSPQSIQSPHAMTSHREQVTKLALCNQCAFWCLLGGQAKLDNMPHLCEEMKSPLEEPEPV